MNRQASKIEKKVTLLNNADRAVEGVTDNLRYYKSWVGPYNSMGSLGSYIRGGNQKIGSYAALIELS